MRETEKLKLENVGTDELFTGFDESMDSSNDSLPFFPEWGQLDIFISAISSKRRTLFKTVIAGHVRPTHPRSRFFASCITLRRIRLMRVW